MIAVSRSRGNSVLILVQNLSVPFDRRVWQEARSLTSAGYDVVVVCPQCEGRDEERMALIEGIEIHRYPLRPTTGGARGYVREYFLAFWHTRRLIRDLSRSRQFSVVHACNPPDLLLLTALSLRRQGAAFVFDHHDLVPELYLSRFGGRGIGYSLAVLAERLTFRLAEVVISTNESYRRVALERGGLRDEDVFVVRSAPDLSRFQAAPPAPELRRGKRHLIAYVGVMGPQDGVDHALRALAELRQRRSDWHAVFVGAGDVFQEMRTLASDLGLDGDVEFTGWMATEQVIRILSTADVGLAPDPKTPFNDASTMNKIVEYMALGLPVVSYDLVEARVSAGDAGVYAAANNRVDFAARISELLDAPARRAAMAQLGKHRLSEELAWNRSEVNLLSAYARALELRSATVPEPRISPRPVVAP